MRMHSIIQYKKPSAEKKLGPNVAARKIIRSKSGAPITTPFTYKRESIYLVKGLKSDLQRSERSKVLFIWPTRWFFRTEFSSKLYPYFGNQ